MQSASAKAVAGRDRATHKGTINRYANTKICLHAVCEPLSEKTNNLGSDRVRHKPGCIHCTVTEDV